MEKEFGMKELYSVVLKTKTPLLIGGKNYAEGEVVAAFDKIQMSYFDERTKSVFARGGFDNRLRVEWTTTEEITLRFSQGVFSKTQFALLSNSSLLGIEKGEAITIFKREELESSEDSKVELAEIPIGDFFIYNRETGELIQDYTIEGKTITLGKPFLPIILDYHYSYLNGGSEMIVGKRLIAGYLELEGKTRVKDDITGHTKTGIIKIPRLKLMSKLSMRLGANADPVMADFQAMGVPTGSREHSMVMEIIFLSDDIDSDF